MDLSIVREGRVVNITRYQVSRTLPQPHQEWRDLNVVSFLDYAMPWFMSEWERSKALRDPCFVATKGEVRVLDNSASNLHQRDASRVEKSIWRM